MTKPALKVLQTVIFCVCNNVQKKLVDYPRSQCDNSAYLCTHSTNN